MIVADASWVIALRDPRDAHHGAAVALGEASEESEILLPLLTLAECLVAPARLDVLDDAATSLRAAFEVVMPDADAPERWARIRADAGLRIPDAVVLDLALTRGAQGIFTFDDGLAAVANHRGLAINAAVG